ncbi:MAG: site-specific integrase [Deltaproteobacteria bacterium]|nr:site-specific integrase [Deltaproteobacteria bacterium]
MANALEDEIIKANPAARMGKHLPKRDRRHKINPLSREEAQLFLGKIKEHYPAYYPFFLTALRTGLRLGELLGLQWGDVDFNGRFLEVRRNLVKGRITTPKNHELRRVDMSGQLADVLKRLKTQRKIQAIKKGWGEVPPWVFVGENGQPLDPDNLRHRVFLKALEKAGLRHFRLHDLRHSYATLRLSKGDDIADVSHQLGHSSVKITWDVYYHWMPGKKKSEVDALDDQTDQHPPAPYTHPAQKKEPAESANPLKFLVAGGGFEPPTFGL